MDQILYLQKITLSHLLHRNVLNRINNSSYYGNDYQMEEYFEDLNRLIFLEDLNDSVNYTRQNLQIFYIKQLINIMESSIYNNIAKSSAYANLDWVYNNIYPKIGNQSSRKHRKYLIYLINELYDKN